MSDNDNNEAAKNVVFESGYLAGDIWLLSDLRLKNTNNFYMEQAGGKSVRSDISGKTAKGFLRISVMVSGLVMGFAATASANLVWEPADRTVKVKASSSVNPEQHARHQHRSSDHHAPLANNDSDSNGTQQRATSAATEQKANSSGQHGGHGRKGKIFQLAGSVADDTEVVLIQPDLEQMPLSLAENQASITSTGKGNYHALVARQKGKGYEYTAIRYLYMHGKPTGNSPSELTDFSISRLELVPDPLPREHWRYVTSKPESFRLLFDSKPLAQSPVTLKTRAGTEQTLLTDREGVLRMSLPEDFAEVVPGRRKNPPGEWQLSSYIRKDGVLYQTSLSGAYSPNSSHWKSYSLGVAVAGIGLGTGLLLNARIPAQSRRRKK